MRNLFWQFTVLVIAVNAILAAIGYPGVLWSLIILGPIILLGIQDIFQTRHSILRNFPVLGHFRFFFEEIRPEIHQYFVESDTDGVPFNRQQRTVVYQRAKNIRDTVPFGTERDVYAVGYEWVNHSITARHMEAKDIRITVAGPDCKQPYSASLLNISAMSYGALSQNAIRSLNLGAKLGNFCHNTGEGGISPYHLQGGDLTWQIGTGYFGCRTKEGQFNPETFQMRAKTPSVKMIEIKLSQGAKPGHGGILPAAKLTKEIAEIRDVPLGHDVESPPGHSAFSTPKGLIEFVAQLRELSDGKPVGFKLCIGKRREFLAICKAMLETGVTPDFITVDGGEGGTGAAPLEFTNTIGAPLIESLILVNNALVGCNLRDRIRIICSGKVTTGFDIIKRLALGADLCNAARGMMMAVGCIQAQKCNTNECPVGVATTNPMLVKGLVPADKSQRVYNFHRNTERSVCEMMGAMGLANTEDLRPWHVMRRVSVSEIRNYSELYEFLEPGALLNNPPESYARAWNAASAESF